ncbi:MAG: flippase [Chloroflexi bacterium]|nr:flippase [Chloroflexota bacterium]
MRTGRTIIKNASVLLLGRLLSLILGIVYTAVLARYIHPIGMGILATATSLASMASLLMNFGLNDLTVRDIATDKSRVTTYIPSLFLARAGLALFFLVILFTASKWANYPPDTFAVIFIYAFAYSFDAFTDICFSVFNAHEKMEYSAALQTGRDLINISLSLIAILLKFNLFVIVGVSAFASLIKLGASLSLLRWKFPKPVNGIDLQLSQKLMLTALPFAALTIVSAVNRQIDTFILSLYRSAQEVGWYAPATLLISNLLLIPTILLQSVFPVLSKFNVSSQDELRRVYSIFFKYLLILGFALCLGTLVTADQIITLLFGPGFEPSALALRILSLTLFWMFGYANGSLLVATGGQNIATRFAVLGIVLTIIASLIATPKFGLMGTALARTAPGALFFIPMTVICHNRLRLRVPYELALKTLAAALLMAAAVAFAINQQIHILIAVLLVAPCVYGVSLLITGTIGGQDFELITQLFRRKSKEKVIP